MKKLMVSVLIIVIAFTLFSCGKSEKANLFDFQIKINDTVYSIPEKIEKFTDAGWKFPKDFKDFDSVITPGNLKSTYLELGENWLAVEIFNYTEGDLALKDCPIGRIEGDFTGDIQVYTAGDFLLNGKTLDEVVAKYGKPLSQTDYSMYTEVIYDKDVNEGIYDRYTFKFNKDTKEITDFDIIYFYG